MNHFLNEPGHLGATRPARYPLATRFFCLGGKSSSSESQSSTSVGAQDQGAAVTGSTGGDLTTGTKLEVKGPEVTGSNNSVTITDAGAATVASAAKAVDTALATLAGATQGAISLAGDSAARIENALATRAAATPASAAPPAAPPAGGVQPWLIMLASGLLAAILVAVAAKLFNPKKP